jgi:hypothetical protein
VAEPLARDKTTASMASAGAGLGTAVRMLTSNKGRNLVSGLLSGGSSMFATFGRVLRALMLQVTGFLFLVIAAMIGSKTVHEYQAYVSTNSSPSRFYLAASFCTLFTYFGLSSFWRSRK